MKIIKLIQAGYNQGSPLYLNVKHIAGFKPAVLKRGSNPTVEMDVSLIWDESGNEDSGCWYVQETPEDIVCLIDEHELR
jgi:hypothetical protein